MDGYRSKDWRAFRDQVIDRDGGQCTSCGRGPADDITLHVHHLTYLPGRKPWDYPLSVCATVCSGCHAAEHGLIAPKFDWEYAGWQDLGDLVGSCECCGTAIRYVFLITHANWFPMEVGTVCCDNLTGSQAAGEFLESQQRYASRLNRFVTSSRWLSYPNGIHHITQKRRVIRIVPADGGFRIFVNGFQGGRIYADVEAAKMRIFEALESGDVDAYFTRPGRKSR